MATCLTTISVTFIFSNMLFYKDSIGRVFETSGERICLGLRKSSISLMNMYLFILIYVLSPNFPTPPLPSVSSVNILSQTTDPPTPFASISILIQGSPSKCADEILERSLRCYKFNFVYVKEPNVLDITKK